MKYGMADVLEPATTEGGLAVEAFIKICPPADRANLDREWLEMCGMFVKGWLAKAAEQSVHPTGGECPVCQDGRLDGEPCPICESGLRPASG